MVKEEAVAVVTVEMVEEEVVAATMVTVEVVALEMAAKMVEEEMVAATMVEMPTRADVVGYDGNSGDGK